MPAQANGYMGRGGMKGTSYQGKTSNDSRARLKKAHAMDPHRHRREKRSIKRFLAREKGRIRARKKTACEQAKQRDHRAREAAISSIL